MQTSIPIGRLFGSRIAIHGSCLVLILAATVYPIWLGHPLFFALHILSVSTALVGSILLHELGHAYVGRLLGFNPYLIQFTPFGAITKFRGESGNGLPHPLVALAGPATNAVFAIAIYLLLWSVSDKPPINFMLLRHSHALPVILNSIYQSGFLEILLWVNIFLAAVNLFPVLPLDGGHILFSLLSQIFSKNNANRIVTIGGYTVSVVMMFSGYDLVAIFGVLSLITTFRASSAIANEILRIPPSLGDSLLSPVVFLEKNDLITKNLDLILSSGQMVFPVLNKGIFIGTALKKDLLFGVGGGRKNLTIGSKVDATLGLIPVDYSLQQAYQKLLCEKTEELIVISEGNDRRVIGIANKKHLEQRLEEHRERCLPITDDI